VARYLLSLDPERRYFSKIKIEIRGNHANFKSRPIIGNFRLNKMLQIIQALYYACYEISLRIISLV
jgi:hypothetical protein